MYHALINALSAHMIHINLNMIFYTHLEHGPTKTIYIKYYTEKQTDTRTTHTHMHTHSHTHNDCHCSRNWVLMLVGMKILWAEDGFQKRNVFSRPLTSNVQGNFAVSSTHIVPCVCVTVPWCVYVTVPRCVCVCVCVCVWYCFNCCVWYFRSFF